MRLYGDGRFVVLASMSLLYFLLMAGTFNSLGIVLPSMVKDLRMNWAEAGFGFTLLGLGCGLASLVPAVSIRRVGVPKTLLVGTLLLVAGFSCMAATMTARLYHVGTILTGVGFCFCGTVAGVHVISKLFERRSTALGVYFTIGNLGAIAGPLLFFGVDGLIENWRLFWVICALGALATGAFAIFMTRGGQGSGDCELNNLRTANIIGWSAETAVRIPQFWVIVSAYTACLLINTSVHSFSVQHLSEQGVPVAHSAGLMGAIALVGAIVAGLAGLVGERVSARTLTLFALGLQALACIILILPDFSTRLGLFAICMGFGFGASYVGTAVLLQSWFGQRANLELYAIMCMVSTSAALGPALGGVMRDYSGNFVAVFIAHAIMGMIVFVILACTKRPQHYMIDADSPRAESKPVAAILDCHTN